MSYLLGDNKTAARRLGVVAAIFEPTTREFLLEAVGGASAGPNPDPPFAAPGLALDLGCGPGHTTRLISRTLGCASTVGIDSSEKFIRLAADFSAADRPAAGTSFLVQDVMSVPFPIGPADLIYSRYLLMHLEDPLDAMSRWASQLGSGGMQLLEELEEVQTDHPLFRLYLRIVEGALADQGKTLYIGGVAAAALADGMSIVVNRVRRVLVPAADAATMFFLNIQTLRKRSYVAANYTAAALDDLEAGLKELVDGGSAAVKTPPVAWSLRQMVFRRVAE